MLHSLGCYKRVNREIDKYSHKLYHDMGLDYCIYLYLEDEHTRNELLILKICKNNDFNNAMLELEISKNYPFHPYKVRLVNIDNNIIRNYSHFLVKLTRKLESPDINHILLYRYVLLYNKKKPKLISQETNLDMCLCCNTVSCTTIWTPSKTFYDMVDEYLEINAISKFINLDLNHHWNNCRLSLLNSDVLSLIIEFCLLET